MESDFIHRILSFVENNYDKQIFVKDLEDISCYSYRNIQRIFKYSCGETIGAYQKRLRVENAYKLIIYTNESLTLIAVRVGFANLSSFSKAFKQQFGISPKEARLNKSVLFKENNIQPVTSDILLKPDVVYIQPRKIYYQSMHTYYVNEEIELLWGKFMRNTFHASATEYFGVIADDPIITDEIKCRYDACSSVQATNKKLPAKMIFGGRYVRFIHTGKYETMEATYEKIYSGWILTSRFEFDHTPIIEQYLKHASNTDCEEDYVTAIFLPLKR